MPLSFYQTFSFFRIRQDAYDRFFTSIEYRYTKDEIKNIYGKYFKDFTFSEQPHIGIFISFQKIKDINLNNIIVMYTYIMYEIKIIKSITLLNKIFLFF